MIRTMRGAACVLATLATLAALFGTAVNFTPAAAAQSHGPAHRSVGGIVVGVIVLAIVVVTSYLLHRRRQRRFRRNEPDEPDEPRG